MRRLCQHYVIYSIKKQNKKYGEAMSTLFYVRYLQKKKKKKKKKIIITIHMMRLR